MAGIKMAGFETPTPIQQQAIPPILAGKDVMGLAQTGTGKTAAFMLPIIQRLTRGPLKRVRALIVAPTRELAEQIRETAVSLSKKTKVKSVAIYGGVGKGPQLDALRRGAEIVVACPGRLLDLHNEKQIDLSHVEVLVLDEADRMFDMGFLPDIRRIIQKLPQERQSLFFSATMPNDIRKLASDVLQTPVTVQIGHIAPAKTVSHALYPVHHKLKTRLTFAILEDLAFGRLLIFTRTKYRAKGLAQKLSKRGYRAAALQGNMSQNQRQKSITGFREGKFDILVATDIAARGIDVAEITHVINFDIPDTVDAYTHRIGRTGRAAETGEAFTFITDDDESMVRSIERVLKKKIARKTVAGFDYEVPVEQNNGSGKRPFTARNRTQKKTNPRAKRNNQRGRNKKKPMRQSP
ncbi:MAG: DEAD/DEAH box helicase [Chloroflexota bacterium]